MGDRLRALLVEAGYVLFAAEHEGRVLGLAAASLSRYFEKSGGYARLLVLVVADSGRSLGIGGMLVERIERWAAGAGARGIFVNGGSHRIQAHRFYEKRGFRPTGIRFVKEIGQKA
jgi:GNAT superfamily N-acetyltransferase